MTYINPLIAPIAQGPQAQRAAAGKERQIARAQALTKNSAAEGDTLEHQVESADGLSAVGDDQPKNGQPRQQPRERKPTDADDDEKPRLDVTA
jgi:hypothetical protein